MIHFWVSTSSFKLQIWESQSTAVLKAVPCQDHQDEERENTNTNTNTQQQSKISRYVVTILKIWEGQSTAVLKAVPCQDHQDEEREIQIQIHKYKVKYQDMS